MNYCWLEFLIYKINAVMKVVPDVKFDKVTNYYLSLSELSNSKILKKLHAGECNYGNIAA